MKTAFALVCMFPLLLAAGQEEKSGQDKLQGTWQVVSLVENGRKAPAEAVKTSTMVIKGNQFTFKGEESYRGTYTIDSSKKPSWIDTKFIDEDNKEKGKAAGIYELQGEQLKISWRAEGKERPTDFDSQPDSGIRSVVLKRLR